MKLKKIIDEDGNVASEFQGVSGKTYKITNKINIERYSVFQKYSLMFSYGINFNTFHQNLQKAMMLADGVPAGKNKFTDLVMHLYGMQEGIVKNAEMKYTLAMYICSLFIVSDDEDIYSWDEESADKKIADWANIEIDDFFLLTMNFVTDLQEKVKEFKEQLQKMN